MKKLYSMLKRIFFLSISLFSVVSAFAQDPTFSQYYANKIYFNPAFAGADRGFRATMNYRNLFTAVPGDFSTFTATVDFSSFAAAGGFGALITSRTEGEGALKTNTYGAMYSYRLTVVPRMWDIHAGLQANYITKQMDWSRFVFSDQLDPVYGNIYQSSATAPDNLNTGFFDFDFGLMTRFNMKRKKTRKLVSNTLGVAVKHVTEPNESLLNRNEGLPRKFNVHYQAIIPISKRRARNLTYFSPNIMYENQRPLSTFNIGAFILRTPVMFGVWYRNEGPFFQVDRTDAVVVNFGIKGTNNNGFNYQFGYSYDLTLSRLAGSSGGSHEVALIIEITSIGNSRSRMAKKRARNCYNFSGPRNMPKIF